MPHRILVVLTIAFVIVLNVQARGQRGATEPPAIARTIGRPMTVVSGTLTGTVRDQSRALVPKIQVIVTLETDANVEPHRTTTDQEGRFRFTGLPLGTYCLTVSERGSEVARRIGIQVRGAQETNIPVVIGERPAPTPELRRACGRREGAR